ncbi:AI-2E family transporter [Sphingomonas sp. So64.6b]|uniref:AI-2E family transporter n=1 Tax=Sphingomonas sp. So64.6b TaxID=2997354 RepID=UPI0016034524|nr:AI-2E family transporter [Sphingomonas sp. So64.6b]QNA84352.1 AI-2E family transporter [Sphingomonas sp. So64.6b]
MPIEPESGAMAKPGPQAGVQYVAEPDRVRTRQLYLTLAIVLLSCWIASEFLTPIAWAAVLAIAEWPLFEKALRRMPDRPGLVAALFTLATALLVILPLSLAAVTLAQESQGALEWLKHAQQSGIAAPAWLAGIPLFGDRLNGWWQQHVANPQGSNALLGTLTASSVLGWTRSIGGEVAKESALFLVTLLALATLLARGREIAAQSREVSVRMFGAFGGTFLERMIGAVRATVNGTVLVSVLEGTIIGIGYGAAGVPQPLLFATFTIVLALVPFGAWAAFGLASLILIGNGDFLAGGLLFAFGVVVMTVGDNVVQPSVIGSAVKLPFLLAMIGAFGGLAQLGLVGLFVGPVVMAALLLVWRQWMSPSTTESADDPVH